VGRRSLARALAAPVAAAGIVAGAAFAAPAAQAQTVNIDTGGTVAITVPLSYVAQLAKAGIVAIPTPLSEVSVSKSSKTATITTNVTGGDADVSVLYGSLDMSGKLHFANVHPVRVVSLGSVQLDINDSEVLATPAGSSTPVVLLDVTGDITTSVTPGTTSTTDTYDSDQLVIDPAGAAYLDTKLHTGAFKAGQTVGTLSATWTVVYPS
jgi:hypothetical protein